MSLHTHRTESRAADPYRFAEPRIRIHKTEEGKQERCRESTYLRDNSVRIAEIKMILFTYNNKCFVVVIAYHVTSVQVDMGYLTVRTFG